MQKLKICLIAGLLLAGTLRAAAQSLIAVPLPDITVWADKCVQGDRDIYGLGTWSCSIKAKIVQRQLVLTGKIIFIEEANDFTLIVGHFTKVMNIAPCLPGGEWAIEPVGNMAGSVAGLNTGASGIHFFEGTGLIQRAYLITDTFGEDTGNIGGTLKLKPLQVRIYPVYCARENKVIGW